VDKWLRRLTTAGISRGMSGSRPWLVTGVVALGLRGLRRMTNPPPKTLFRATVKPGDAFAITAVQAERTRRRRGRAK
jgi:hypothetical protein